MKSRIRVIISFSVLISSVGIIGYLAAHAHASGTPTAPMLYSGILTDMNGMPLLGTKSIQIRLMDADKGGKERCGFGPASQTLVNGEFRIVLPDECIVAVHDTPDLWVEVIVDSDVLPRNKLGLVPYALESHRAVEAISVQGGVANVSSATVNGQPIMTSVAAGSGLNGRGTASDPLKVDFNKVATADHSHSGRVLGSVRLGCSGNSKELVNCRNWGKGECGTTSVGTSCTNAVKCISGTPVEISEGQCFTEKYGSNSYCYGFLCVE